ncbi:MAG: TIGR04438 family Trp-rich protein [Burkholderiaceae bacterium]
MYLVWLGLVLIVLKLLNVNYVGELSWWWIVLPLALALIWFEFFERRLGLDKKRAHDEYDQARQQRFKQTLIRNDKRR